MHSDTLSLLIDLTRRESVTPEDAGCQTLIAQRLEPLGFSIERMDGHGVSNTWARRGNTAPLLVFAGHTDVVPVGDTAQWTFPPFSATQSDGKLFARGAADMKSGLAAMITAIERFIKRQPDHQGSIAMLLTSDEEGPALHGTRRVVDKLEQRGESIDFCVVGEPTSNTMLGDTVRIGRRGSLGASLRINGTQGHVAYPHLADNPVHRAMPALAALTQVIWDQGDRHFPPTTLQISNIHAGTGASNVIPGYLEVDFNLRYGPATGVVQIREKVQSICEDHGLDYQLQWKDSAQPFITEPGTLTTVIKNAIKKHTDIDATLDTGGGTSDGRFIAPTGAQLIEFGPINASIHQVDENVCIGDIDTLSCIYEEVLAQLLDLNTNS